MRNEAGELSTRRRERRERILAHYAGQLQHAITGKDRAAITFQRALALLKVRHPERVDYDPVAERLILMIDEFVEKEEL